MSFYRVDRCNIKPAPIWSGAGFAGTDLQAEIMVWRERMVVGRRFDQRGVIFGKRCIRQVAVSAGRIQADLWIGVGHLVSLIIRGRYNLIDQGWVNRPSGGCGRRP